MDATAPKNLLLYAGFHSAANIMYPVWRAKLVILLAKTSAFRGHINAPSLQHATEPSIHLLFSNSFSQYKYMSNEHTYERRNWQVPFKINTNMEYGEHKDQKKIPEKGYMGTYFEDRNSFHTLFSFLSLKSNLLFLVKCSGLIFPAGCPNSFHQRYVSAARRATAHKMCLPFIPFVCTVTCNFIWMVQEPKSWLYWEGWSFQKSLGIDSS